MKAIIKFIILGIIGIIFSGCAAMTNIEKGDSKQEIINKLIEEKVYMIRPELEEVSVVNQTNIYDIDKYLFSNGIILDGSEYKIHIDFINNIVTNLYVPLDRANKKLDIKIGDNKKDILLKLKKFIKYNEGYYIYDYLPDSRGVKLLNLSVADKKYLEKHDVWAFIEPGGYSDYKLVFINQILYKVIFNYRPIELP